ncbi:hypothetical protein A0H81_12707 [Grifola frondosa]|uniref:Autophagy-related protein 11 n=1 Tax=Grifola frondosa TaxID=5627 RepID=A0A1C7LTW7_GRIFR|nr:hypothetical protein A0H81_12707 [Grifola frondosa]
MQLSSSRLLSHRRRSPEDDQAYAELEIQIQELQQLRAEQESFFQHDRSALEAEIAQLRDALQTSEAARGPLERDLHSARAQLESEATSRRIMEERNAQLCADADGNRQSLARALAEATEQTKAAEILRQELARARAQFEDVKALEARNAQKVASLLEEQANTLARLEEARARGEGPASACTGVGARSSHADHIAEADGDRAVLDTSSPSLRRSSDCDRQLKDTHAQAEMAVADAVGLREELQRVEHELREARQSSGCCAMTCARDGRHSRLRAALETAAGSSPDPRRRARVPRFAREGASGRTDDGVTPPRASRRTMRAWRSRRSGAGHSLLGNLGEPEPIDPSDPASALEALRAFDHDHFLEAIGRAGSTMRKWQKQCKEYRERAKGKISFRNFAKGDLALFLPTRNSVSKPWAAFNVSFPHYFLQATGHLAEQLKTREWIVARITSITERVVDVREPSTNPYGLGDGVNTNVRGGRLDTAGVPVQAPRVVQEGVSGDARTGHTTYPRSQHAAPGPAGTGGGRILLGDTPADLPPIPAHALELLSDSGPVIALAPAGSSGACGRSWATSRHAEDLTSAVTHHFVATTPGDARGVALALAEHAATSRFARVARLHVLAVLCGARPVRQRTRRREGSATTAISEQEISTLMSRSDAFGVRAGHRRPRRRTRRRSACRACWRIGGGPRRITSARRLLLGLVWGGRREREQPAGEPGEHAGDVVWAQAEARARGEVVESPTSASKPSSPSPLGAGQDTVVEAPSPSA